MATAQEILANRAAAFGAAATSPTISTTTQKRVDLAGKEKDKRAALGYEDDILLGLNDADSPITEAFGGSRSVAPDGTRYDSVELKHGNYPYDMQGKTKAERDAGVFGKSEYSMQMQREQAARITGKPVEAVTQADMIDVANMQQVQKLADVSRGAGEDRWQAPFIPGAEQLNLTGSGYRDENDALVDGTG